jgi:type I restriction enzyme S subunit
LRFNGFDGEWETCLLSDVTKYIKGYAFKSEDYQDNGVRIIRVSDLSSDRIKNDVEKVYIDEIKSKIYDKYKLRKGNIVVTTVGSKPEMLESAVGRGIFICNANEGLLNQNMLKFENIKNVDNGFIIGLINTKRYQQYMKSIARGNANQANITVVDLLQYEISFPTLPEQQKIASFLSAVDEKIQQLSSKKELLEQYKKGIMQQLFSGKLRFKDENGNDYADWEEKLLGSLTERNICYGVVQPGIEDENGVKFIRGGDVFNGCISRNLRVISKEITDNYKRTYLKGGELIMSLVGYPGETAIVPDYLRGSNLARQVGLIDLKRTTNSVYVHYYISSSYGKRNLLGKTIGSAQQVINIVDLKKLKIPLPSLLEQQKIADFLSSVDAKIESTSQQINQTQSFKKGLLQQLFV